MVHAAPLTTLLDQLALAHPVILDSVAAVLTIPGGLHLLLLVLVVLVLVLLWLQLYLGRLANDHLNITGV